MHLWENKKKKRKVAFFIVLNQGKYAFLYKRDIASWKTTIKAWNNLWFCEIRGRRWVPVFQWKLNSSDFSYASCSSGAVQEVLDNKNILGVLIFWFECYLSYSIRLLYNNLTETNRNPSSYKHFSTRQLSEADCSQSIELYCFSTFLALSKKNGNIILYIKWHDGENRDLLTNRFALKSEWPLQLYCNWLFHLKILEVSGTVSERDPSFFPFVPWPSSVSHSDW